MNSTSESSSRAWRLMVGVLPIGFRRWMAVSSTPFIRQNAFARWTVPSRLPSSISMMRRGFSVCRSTDARQSTMLSASFSAGMMTSTVASRQSSAGVGRVRSGPRRTPIRLSTVLGLTTK
jgi:hypothetical protein